MTSQGGAVRGAVRFSAAPCAGGQLCCWTRPRTGPIAQVSCWRLTVGLVVARRSESLRMRLGRRAAAAFGGCLRSRAGPPVGSSARGGCGRAHKAAVRNGSALLPRFARGRVVLVGASRCLWSPSVLGSLPRQRLKEADWSGGIKPDRCCCGAVSFGLTPPAQPAWASPADAARNPEHNTLIGKKDPPNEAANSCRTVLPRKPVRGAGEAARGLRAGGHWPVGSRIGSRGQRGEMCALTCVGRSAAARGARHRQRPGSRSDHRGLPVPLRCLVT